MATPTAFHEQDYRRALAREFSVATLAGIYSAVVRCHPVEKFSTKSWAGSDDIDRVKDRRGIVNVTADCAGGSPCASLCTPTDEVMGR